MTGRDLCIGLEKRFHGFGMPDMSWFVKWKRTVVVRKCGGEKV